MNVRALDPHRFESDSVERAVALLSDRWTFLILREAFFGVRRFSELVRNLGIARNVLTKRLEALTAAGLFVKDTYNEAGTWAEYRLTAMGRDCYGAILALMRWGDRYLADGNGPPLTLHHVPCGKDFVANVVCSQCGEVVEARDVVARPGPGMSGRRPRSRKR